MAKYRVTGPKSYLGHAPDSVFETNLDADQEARAIARGAIEKVRAYTKAAEVKDKDADRD